MRIRNIRHKGLRRFTELDEVDGLPPAQIEKIRNILTFLQDMGHEDELRSIALWKAHKLAGERKDTWSLHVSRNWRITFRIDQGEIEIFDLDYEDYH
jgi:proteic killer suppression protein